MGAHALEARLELGLAEARGEGARLERRPDGEDAVRPQSRSRAPQPLARVKVLIPPRGEGLGAVVDVEQDRVVALARGPDDFGDVSLDDAHARIEERRAR